MKVKELIEQLQALPQDLEMVWWDREYGEYESFCESPQVVGVFAGRPQLDGYLPDDVLAYDDHEEVALARVCINADFSCDYSRPPKRFSRKTADVAREYDEAWARVTSPASPETLARLKAAELA